MSKRLKSNEEYLEELKASNLKIKNYNILTEYKGAHEYIYVQTYYGVCKITANNLKKNTPTVKCAVDKTEYFVNESIEIHQNLYNYSLVKYVNRLTPVEIICKKHGPFWQTPQGHLSGRKCEKCARPRTGFTKQDIINELECIYEYTPFELIEFKSLSQKMLVKDSYGEMLVYPENILKGIIPTITSAVDRDKYLKNQIKEVFDNDYELSKVKYINVKENIVLDCKKHGEFSKDVRELLKGHGCQKCSKIDRKGIIHGWSHSRWQKAGELSNYFDSFKVYILKCWNDNEGFYKIGKTFRTVQERFNKTEKMPYGWEIIRIFEGEARQISKLEHSLQKLNKRTQYLPKNTFGGMHECFSNINKETLEYKWDLKN